jgi:hypothetical protein
MRKMITTLNAMVRDDAAARTAGRKAPALTRSNRSAISPATARLARIERAPCCTAMSPPRKTRRKFLAEILLGRLHHIYSITAGHFLHATGHLHVGSRRSDRMSRPAAVATISSLVWSNEVCNSRFAWSEYRCYIAAIMAPYRRANNTLAFSCDAGCGCQCRTTDVTFKRATQTLRQRGWSVKRRRNRWLHHCPVCAKAIWEGRPVPCQLDLWSKAS